MNDVLETEEEVTVHVPAPDEFVACTQCGHRSSMHYFFRDGLLSYCKHHGEQHEAKLTELGAFIVLDTRDQLT